MRTRFLVPSRLRTAVVLALVMAAAGGSAVRGGSTPELATIDAQPAAAVSQTVLPFALPSVPSLRSSPKKVFAHYLPSMPVSFDNRPPASDTYAVQYLSPRGEEGKHAAYGGFLRDRPLPRPVRTDEQWALEDAETEVRQAISAGIDGFTLDLLKLPGDPDATAIWTHSRRMMQAAQNVDPGFKIVLMPDMTTSARSRDAKLLAKYVAELAQFKSAYRMADGRLVVSPFLAEQRTLGWWRVFLAEMRNTYRIDVALWPLFLEERVHGPLFAPFSFGISHWGARNPLWNDPEPTYKTSRLGRVQQMHLLGKKWMQPVSVQDARPRSGVYEEAENTQNLRDTWEIAIESDSDWVHLITWNDYTEGTQMAPSAKNGWSYLDINAYYLTWFKTGRKPAIARDAVYVTHRRQFAGARPTFPQTKLMNLRGGSKPRDTVEALTFLTKPGTVKVAVGSKTYSCNAPAGVGVCTVPLGTGAVSAKVLRGSATVAAVTSPLPVTGAPLVQDLQYVAASSRRTPAPATVPRETASPVTTLSLTPSADTYANQGAPDRNFGGGSSLASAGTPGAVSYLRFDLPKPPPGKTLYTADLRIRTAKEKVAGSAALHTVQLASNTWSEGAVKWANRPRFKGVQLGVVPRRTTPNQYLKVSLSADRLRPLGGTQQTVAVNGTGPDGLWFWSSEHASAAYRPQLILVYK